MIRRLVLSGVGLAAIITASLVCGSSSLAIVNSPCAPQIQVCGPSVVPMYCGAFPSPLFPPPPPLVVPIYVPPPPVPVCQPPVIAKVRRPPMMPHY